MPCQNQLVGCALCLMFAIAGGFVGYNLNSPMQNPNRAEKTSDLLELQNNRSIKSSTAVLGKDCEQPTFAKAAESQPGVNTLSPYDGNKASVKNLTKQIRSIASQQGIDLNLDDLANTEVEFVDMVDNSPDVIHALLDVYEQMSDGETKDFFRSLLATTGSDQIQQRGVDYLSKGDIPARADWLALLRDAGIHTTGTRNKLFTILPTLSRPEEIRDAVLAISPEIVSTGERQDVVSQLNPYLDHNDDIVRSAAIETLAKWGDSNQAIIIEEALSDSSDQVRYTAVSAAYSSQIRSENIELMLLDIMNDTDEDSQMRIHAHNALSNYPLQGQNYDQFYKFHQQLIADENTSGPKG